MHEECGVFGIWSPVKRAVPRDVYLGLYALQHRGQESCGIAVSCDGVFHHYKGDGLVGEVFDRRNLNRLEKEALRSDMSVIPPLAVKTTIISSPSSSVI